MKSPARRILCADDNEDTCFMLAALLGQAGCEATAARTVSDALRLAGDGGFDLYVLDNKFPDGSGAELCRSIRRFDPLTPVLFYSGAAFDSDREESLAAGAQEYVAKPDIDALTKAVRRLLGQNDV